MLQMVSFCMMPFENFENVVSHGGAALNHYVSVVDLLISELAAKQE